MTRWSTVFDSDLARLAAVIIFALLLTGLCCSRAGAAAIAIGRDPSLRLGGELWPDSVIAVQPIQKLYRNKKRVTQDTI